MKKVNQGLKDQKYEEEAFWESLFGNKIGDMWREYSESIEEKSDETANTDHESMREQTSIERDDSRMIEEEDKKETCKKVNVATV